MARYKDRVKARIMRKKGISIITIGKELNVPKSSVSLWCRDILLTSKQIEQLKKQKGSVMGRWLGAESNRKKKREAIEKAKKEASLLLNKISDKDLLIAGLCLFWAEGSKTGSRFIFVNSDPIMLKIMKNFLTKVLLVDREQIRATIQINSVHEPRIKKITNFWSKCLEIPTMHFSKPYYIHVTPKKVYENYDKYNGILRLRVLRSSNLQYKMLGLIETFQHYFMSM